jgi:hypothetical protein
MRERSQEIYLLDTGTQGRSGPLASASESTGPHRDPTHIAANSNQERAVEPSALQDLHEAVTR